VKFYPIPNAVNFVVKAMVFKNMRTNDLFFSNIKMVFIKVINSGTVFTKLDVLILKQKSLL